MRSKAFWLRLKVASIQYVNMSRLKAKSIPKNVLCMYRTHFTSYNCMNNAVITGRGWLDLGCVVGGNQMLFNFSCVNINGPWFVSLRKQLELRETCTTQTEGGCVPG